MKYKVGDRVKIKSLDWYKENRDDINEVECGGSVFVPAMTTHCGYIRTISKVFEIQEVYHILEDNGLFTWTDEMIEKRVEEETKPKDMGEVNEEYYSTTKYLVRPNGYQFVDENGNIINATKIVLEKKKKEYPKTYEECCEVLGIGSYFEPEIRNATTEECHKFTKLMRLKRCRDAYWKLYGEEMGLGKPWSPTDSDYITGRYCIFVHRGNILCDTPAQDCVLTFPTEEMRDAFRENFDPDIEICKELL